MIDRLKKLRKELNLTQAAFAKRIGLKQSAIGDIESGKNKLKTQNFNAICREFNVNPAWLETGEGEMFLNPPTLDKLAVEYDLTTDEVALIKSFIQLPADDRKIIIQLMQNFAKNTLGVQLPQQTEDTILEKSDDELDVDEQLEIIKGELIAQKRERTSSASTGTNGIKRSRKFSS